MQAVPGEEGQGPPGPLSAAEPHRGQPHEVRDEATPNTDGRIVAWLKVEENEVANPYFCFCNLEIKQKKMCEVDVRPNAVTHVH